MARLIGFTGLKGSGKDTAAAGLEGTIYRVQMAGALKAMIQGLLQYAGHTQGEASMLVEDPAHKEAPAYGLFGRTPRHAMQTLGTEWGRTCMHPDFWVFLADARIRYLQSGDPLGALVAVTDVRFPNEAQMVKRLGGVMVRVERPGLVADTHASEAQIMDLPVDVVLVNDSASAAEFRAKAAAQLAAVLQ